MSRPPASSPAPSPGRRTGPPARRMRGFEPASALVVARIRSGAESRGFAVARLLTHWAEIVGPENAARSRPVRISHGKGFGATLTLLARGADAPLLQMQLPAIRDRVNAVYGFNAVARVVLTQTAASGFAEAQAAFAPRPADAGGGPTPEARSRAEAMARGFADPVLAQAIAQLALNTLSRRAAPGAPGVAPGGAALTGGSPNGAALTGAAPNGAAFAGDAAPPFSFRFPDRKADS